MSVEDRLGDREAEACPWILAASFVRKKRVNSRCWSSGSCPCLSPRRRSIASSPTTERQADPPACRSELDRVRDQVVEDLPEPHPVGSHRRGRLDIELEHDLGGRGTESARLRSHPRRSAEVDVLDRDLQLPGVDLRDEQQVVDQRKRRALLRSTAASIVRCSSLISPASRRGRARCNPGSR